MKTEKLKNKNFTAAFILNWLFLAAEAAGTVLSLRGMGMHTFMFYTQDSNYLAMTVGIIFALFALRQLLYSKPVPHWVYVLRYISACCLALTFTVVLAVLVPMSGPAALVPMFTGGSMLYHHLLCPVMSVVSFVFFERDAHIESRETVWALLPTFIYAAVLVALNFTRTVYGPYPFLHVYEQPIWMSAVWAVVIIGINYLSARLLMHAGKKMRSRDIKEA